MNLFRKNKPAPLPERKRLPLVHIYTDASGNKWYAYENPNMLPGPRAIRAEIATRHADLKLTPNEQRSLFKYMKEEGNKGNFVDVFAVINEMEYRMDFCGEENTLLDLGMVYYSIEGENETVVDEEANKRKRKILENDSAAKDFFLYKSYQLTTDYSNTSEEDIHAYFLTQMKENQVAGAKLAQLLRRLR